MFHYSASHPQPKRNINFFTEFFVVSSEITSSRVCVCVCVRVCLEIAEMFDG